MDYVALPSRLQLVRRPWPFAHGDAPEIIAEHDVMRECGFDGSAPHLDLDLVDAAPFFPGDGVGARAQMQRVLLPPALLFLGIAERPGTEPRAARRACHLSKDRCGSRSWPTGARCGDGGSGDMSST